MYKTIIAVILACIACASAGILTAAPSAVAYTASPEFPSASGYEYQHTIQTADYTNHASVVKPLNGFVDAPTFVRTVYNAPVVAAPAW